MGHLCSRLFNPPKTLFNDNNDLSFADPINICGAQEIGIDQINSLQDLAMENTELSWSTSQELLLSSPSAAVFLEIILEGGGGYLDPAVAEEIETTREALANIG